MRTLLGVAIGLTLYILWHTLGWPFIGWALTRLPPTTPEGWAPKLREWKNGELQ